MLPLWMTLGCGDSHETMAQREAFVVDSTAQHYSDKALNDSLHFFKRLDLARQEGRDEASMKGLSGTHVLQNSIKLIAAKNDGYFLTSVKSTECQDTPHKTEFTSFTKTARSNGTEIITIELQITANCCYHFLGEIEIIGNTLNIIYHGYGGHCSCTCCFGLEYELSALNPTPIEYMMINGDSNSKTKITQVGT